MQGLQNQTYAVFMLLVLLNNIAAQIMPNFVPQRDLYEVRERPSKIYKWTSKWPYFISSCKMKLRSHDVSQLLSSPTSSWKQCGTH